MAELNQVLQMIASHTKADAQQLIEYAAEDELGGYHIDETLRLWPMGSLWGVEGQILYALIRYFKPETVVQIGGWAGASAAHLALAVKANGKGHVTSVDNGGDGNTEHGNLLPKELQEYVTLIWANGEDWLAEQPDHSIDLMFEDASHATELVEKLTKLAFDKVTLGGLLINHDAAHDFAIVGGGQQVPSPVGVAIRDGLTRAGVYYRVYRAEPSDCGISLTVMPGGTKPALSPIATDHLAALSQSYEDELRTLSSNEFKRLHQNEWIQGEQIGNANIESVSEPPPVVEKKTRTRKPKAQ